MLRESIPSHGTLKLELRNAAGKLKASQTHNLVVNLGIAGIAARIHKDAEPKVTHMALGTGNAAVLPADIALGTETARVAMQSTNTVTEVVADDAVQFVAEFGPGVGTGALTEAGLFTAASAGKMWCRSVFGALTKEAEDTLTIAWVLRIGA